MNLEQQKKQAGELLRAIRVGNQDAISRLRRHHSRWTSVDEATVRQLVALHDAQFALAREQGFASWPKLKTYAEPSSRSRHARLFVADVGWIADRVQGLLRTRQSAGPAALEQIREWHPQFADRTDEEIRLAPFTEQDARLVYAREHGFDTWDDLTSRANPGLASERGTNGNTRLNLAVSFAGRPDWKGGVSAIEALLAAGADANDANDRGGTPLHQAAYSNKPEIANILLAKGAALDAEAHGAGGTPLITALFWGHREVADLLGRHAVSPNNLRAAAGLGVPELVEASFSGERTLTSEAGAARGFYRPHSGFPDWHPSTDPQEVLDEALVWACKSNRVNVLERLGQAGARLDCRSLSRYAADLGRSTQPHRGSHMAVGSRRPRQSERYLRWIDSRSRRYCTPHGRSIWTHADGEASGRTWRGSIHQRRSLPLNSGRRRAIFRADRGERLPALA